MQKYSWFINVSTPNFIEFIMASIEAFFLLPILIFQAWIAGPNT